MKQKNKKVKKFKPLKCPHCEKFLTYVLQNVYEVYDFNSKTGRYNENVVGGEQYIKCPLCVTDISDVFEEGVCNYQTEQRKEEK